MRWGTEQSKAAGLSLRYLSKHIKNILDLGCGYGRDTLYFKRNYNSIFIDGIDASQKASNIYTNYLNDHSGIEYLTIDLVNDNLLELNRKYDVIFSNYLFHLFSYEECKKVFKEIVSILNYNGLFISSFVSINDRHFGKGRKLDNNLYEIFRGIPWLFFDESMIENLANIANLQILSLLPYHELELVCGKPDPVDAFLLVAQRFQCFR